MQENEASNFSLRGLLEPAFLEVELREFLARGRRYSAEEGMAACRHAWSTFLATWSPHCHYPARHPKNMQSALNLSGLGHSRRACCTEDHRPCQGRTELVVLVLHGIAGCIVLLFGCPRQCKAALFFAGGMRKGHAARCFCIRACLPAGIVQKQGGKAIAILEPGT